METTQRGLLSFPNREWQQLSDEEKTFVQTYNSKVKHDEPTDDLPRPQGLVIKNTPRRIPRSFNDPTLPGSSTSQTPIDGPSKKQQTTPKDVTRKKIRFDIDGGNEDVSDEEEDKSP